MVDRYLNINAYDIGTRNRPRWGSLASGRTFLDLPNYEESENRQPTAFRLDPVNSNIYARRHSAHTCPVTEEKISAIPPPVPLRPPPAVPKRKLAHSHEQKHQLDGKKLMNSSTTPSSTKNRPLPPIPPTPPARNVSSSARANNNSKNNINNVSSKPVDYAFEFNSKLAQAFGVLPSASLVSPPIVNHKLYHKSNVKTINKGSIRQDSSVSSDSFSQNSSPSYTTKSMETPLLPPQTPNKLLSKTDKKFEGVNNLNQTITKSASTPASLQTIVKCPNGSSLLVHHRILKDIRRPSGHYVHRVRFLRFGFVQVIINALALLGIGVGMAAYFRAYPLEIHIINNGSVNASSFTPIFIYEKPMPNPAPGICLPVIVSFCQQHKVPYNFTVYPNFMGHFGQLAAQQELEVYDAVVDVRCYELAALFLCSVFVPKCGPNGALIGPCKSLCKETQRRCGFFFDVFGLELPDYVLGCVYFPDEPDPDICIGYREVIEAKAKAARPVCPSGFSCDDKRCIPKDWRCDGHVDCQDQTDEYNCTQCGPGMIHCGEDRCMSQEHMCDGTIDCPWAQDERNCLRLSERNGDEGSGQLEVFRPGQKQWVPACVTHWNHTSTAHQVCSVLGYSNSSGSQWRGHETTLKWKLSQSKPSKNMIRDFASCREKVYSTVNITCTNYVCGRIRKTYSHRRLKRIVGGVASKPGDWPFLAAVLGGPEEIFYCAGVLIADQWVLTASHCVGNHSDVSGWTIQLGITRRRAHSFYGQKLKVKRVVPHPKYNLGMAHDNDIALFQLSSRVTFHEHLLPVCLPPANRELKPGTVCTVIGWGKREDTGMSEYAPEINEVEVPVLNRELCNKWLENRELNVTDGMICAGYKEGGKDACQGDSGGPLLCRDKDQDRWFVGGIVSWGIKCAHPHLPGVYAYVPKYIPWILEQIELYAKLDDLLGSI